jgi:outer membrane protein assembly factor BamA
VLTVAGLLISAVLVQGAPSTADTAQRPRLTALPVVSYSDVTGLQYGATLFRGFRTGTDSTTRSSSGSAYASHTAKGHTKVYGQLDRWSALNTARLRVRGEYMSYPLPFFGVGAATPDSAEEWYSHGVTTAQLFLERSLRASAYVHAGVRYLHTRTREAEPAGQLANTRVPGSSGGNVLVSELGAVVDSRDNPGAPRRGTFTRVIPSIAARVLGGDFSFRRLTIDARQYLPIGADNIAAFQLQYDGVSGTAPFDQMPMIGADTAMRGYARGRYRDQHAFTAQAEVRSSYWRRAGLVAFAGAGTVAPKFSRLTSGDWYPSVGFGVRVLLVPKDRTVGRADLGLGRGSVGISLGIGEAF